MNNMRLKLERLKIEIYCRVVPPTVARRTIRGGILVGVVTVVSPVALPVAAVGGAAVLVAIGGIKAGKKVRRSIANRK